MLSVNVAGLLRSTPGTVRTYPVTATRLDLGDDLHQGAALEGVVRLTRTNRGLFVEGRLSTSLIETCSRCLGPATAAVDVVVLDEALPSVDIETGGPQDQDAEPDVLRIDSDHTLDLKGPVREAISLAEPMAPLCRPDCRGLCPVCGRDRNKEPHSHHEAEVDPRLAPLAGLLPDEKE